MVGYAQPSNIARGRPITPVDPLSRCGYRNAVQDDAAPEVEPSLDLRRVLLAAVLGMMGFTLLAAVLGWLFREPLLEMGHWFVDNFGGLGIAVGFFFPDAFTVPVPNDAFTAFGLWGGMPFAEVVAWGSVGSLIGGSTGWVIGRYLLTRSERLQGFIQRRGGEQIRTQLVRGGRWFLAVAAVSPVPYSVTCWAAGVTKMRYWEFLSISLLRIPRVAGILWLIQQGFVSVTG
jgi:membrane protein YqaA with SNARE-associated domain